MGAVANYQEWMNKCSANSGKGTFCGGWGNGSYGGSYPQQLYTKIQQNTSGLVVPDQTEPLDHTAPGALVRWPRLPGTSSGQLWLSDLEWGYGMSGSVQPPRTFCLLYDRLCHTAGLTTTVGTEQTTGLPTPALTRYTDGEGVGIMVDWYSGNSISGGTIVARYINTKGQVKETPPTPFGVSNTNSTSANVTQLPLASGDTGVLSVQSVTLSNTGTGGNFGITLYKPLAFTPIDSTAQVERNATRNMFNGGGVVEIKPNACLALMHYNAPNSTAGHYMMGRVGYIEA